MTIVASNRALWVWPLAAALVFGSSAALISGQASVAEIFARVLAAIAAGLAVSFVALVLAALLRSHAHGGPRSALPQADIAQVKPDAS